MTQDALYLNAAGMINALGNSNSEIVTNLIRGDVSGVQPWDIQVQGKTVYVGQVQGDLPKIPQEFAEFDCRNNQLLLAAYEQIETQVEALKSHYAADRIAVVLGTSTSGILEGEQALQYKSEHGDFPPNFDYRQQEIGTTAIFLRDYLGLRGLAYTVSTACSSSAKVFASAKRLIHSGLCDAAIIGGADSLCRLTVHGFSSLESVAAGRCNPMSKNRDGINIGEAAALFILSKDEAAVQLLGVGESSDAHHMSAPHPQGLGAIAAMQAALDDAKLNAEQIQYINMHGTATPLNDAMESLAIERIFGQQTPISSTKPLIGHTLGAAGASEVGFCWLLLNQQDTTVMLPPHVWDQQRDESLPALRLVAPQETLRIGSGTAFLSNSFAFGGNNASVIIAQR